MSRKVTIAMKKQIAGRQYYKCNNKPGAKLIGLDDYKCPLWLSSEDNKGSFDNSGYEIDHITEWSITKNDNPDNLQALCKSCHCVKTKLFQINKTNKTKTEHNSKQILKSKVSTNKKNTTNIKADIDNNNTSYCDWLMNHNIDKYVTRINDIGLVKLINNIVDEMRCISRENNRSFKNCVEWIMLQIKFELDIICIGLSTHYYSDNLFQQACQNIANYQIQFQNGISHIPDTIGQMHLCDRLNKINYNAIYLKSGIEKIISNSNNNNKVHFYSEILKMVIGNTSQNLQLMHEEVATNLNKFNNTNMSVKLDEAIYCFSSIEKYVSDNNIACIESEIEGFNNKLNYLSGMCGSINGPYAKLHQLVCLTTKYYNIWFTNCISALK